MYSLIDELRKPINLLEPMYLFSWEVKRAVNLQQQGVLVLIPAPECLSGFKAQMIKGKVI